MRSEQEVKDDLKIFKREREEVLQELEDAVVLKDARVANIFERRYWKLSAYIEFGEHILGQNNGLSEALRVVAEEEKRGSEKPSHVIDL